MSSTAELLRADFWATWHRVGAQQQAQQQAWLTLLRAHGVKAAHPDDGWHDRAAHAFSLQYPHLRSTLAPGDVVALGTPASYRLFTVRAITMSGPLARRLCYHYDPAEVRGALHS